MYCQAKYKPERLNFSFSLLRPVYHLLAVPVLELYQGTRLFCRDSRSDSFFSNTMRPPRIFGAKSELEGRGGEVSGLITLENVYLLVINLK